MKCVLCQKDFDSLKGLNSHLTYCEKTIHLKPIIIRMYVVDLLGIKEISKITSINKCKIIEYLGDNKRNASEANVVAHKKFPDKFKHSEEAKKKMRDSHIKWMKEHPEKTAWRLANLSYPEKLFLNKMKELKWDDKYLVIREKSMFPFYIDFAFDNEKVAVEIDGSQHLEEDRKRRDDEKDKLLIENGWMVLRFSDKEIKTNISNCFFIIEKYLNEKFIPSLKRVGIVKELKKRNKKEKNSNGLTDDQINGCKKQRMVERPSYDSLIKEIEELGLEGVGRKYGVTGRSIKKWIKYYEKYENCKTNQLNHYLNKKYKQRQKQYIKNI